MDDAICKFCDSDDIAGYVVAQNYDDTFENLPVCTDCFERLKSQGVVEKRLIRGQA